MNVFFTRDQLIKACKVADRTKRNRRIAWEKIATNVQYFPVTFAFPHNDGEEMRVEIVMDFNGATAYLDIPFETYNSLADQGQDWDELVRIYSEYDGLKGVK